MKRFSKLEDAAHEAQLSTEAHTVSKAPAARALATHTQLPRLNLDKRLAQPGLVCCLLGCVSLLSKDVPACTVAHADHTTQHCLHFQT